MKFAAFNQPRLYLRRDPDAGWTLAVWKWRVFFDVVVTRTQRSSLLASRAFWIGGVLSALAWVLLWKWIA